MNRLLEDLKAVRSLLSVPERWTKNVYARAGKKRIGPLNDEATCWCVLGAVRRVTKLPEDSAYFTVVTSAIAAQLPEGAPRIHKWNDDPSRTHADVLALLDKAIAAEEQK